MAKTNMKNHDVYSYGVISSSTLYLIEDYFPARSGYAEIVEKYKNVGGEAANTSIVLSRLGLKVKLDGNWINPDEDADFLQDVFSKNDVDISRISFRRCQGPKEMLVVDSDDKNVLKSGRNVKARNSKSAETRQISEIKPMVFNNINIYDLLDCDYLVATVAAVEKLQEMYK